MEAKNQGKGAWQAQSDNAGNLANKLRIAKGARVMLTTHLWQPAGLVNGAQGTVYNIACNTSANPYKDPSAVIMADFDGYDGPPYLTTNDGRTVCPIFPITRDFLVGNETCSRTQFPLIVAFAITVHKCHAISRPVLATLLSHGSPRCRVYSSRHLSIVRASITTHPRKVHVPMSFFGICLRLTIRQG